MSRRSRVHKVGMTAAVLGLLSIYLLPFVSVAPNRLVTGHNLSALQALGPVLALAVGAPWAILGLLSLGNRRSRWFASGRGVAAAAGIVVALWAADLAAAAQLPAEGPYARISVAGGPWIVAFLAYAVILSARRELEGDRWPRSVVTLLAPVALGVLLVTGRLSDLGVIVEYHNQQAKFWSEAWIQLVVSGAAIVIAVVLGVWLGLLAFSRRSAERPVFAAVNLFQTIPGLAMIGLLIGPLAALANAVPALRSLGVGGLGWAPLLIALTLYALLPIVRNTFEGLRAVPRSAIDAGLGMGMSSGQLMRKVQLPIARPVMFTGVRTSSVQTVGNATLGAFVGGLGLGFFVVQGLAEQATDLILLGSIGIVALALLVNAVMRVVEKLATPRGLRQRGTIT